MNKIFLAIVLSLLASAVEARPLIYGVAPDLNDRSVNVCDHPVFSCGRYSTG